MLYKYYLEMHRKMSFIRLSCQQFRAVRENIICLDKYINIHAHF